MKVVMEQGMVRGREFLIVKFIVENAGAFLGFNRLAVNDDLNRSKIVQKNVFVPGAFSCQVKILSFRPKSLDAREMHGCPLLRNQYTKKSRKFQ